MLIVDAYNLLHAAASRPGKVTGLSLGQFCNVCANMKLTLVMDGVRKPSEPYPDDYDTLHLQWAGRGRSADDTIVLLCESSTGRRDICVVTDDRQLRARVMALGAKTLHCGVFLRQVYTYRREQRERQERTAKQASVTSAGETEFWMRVFGFSMPAENNGKQDPSIPRDSHQPKFELGQMTEADIDAIDMSAYLD